MEVDIEKGLDSVGYGRWCAERELLQADYEQLLGQLSGLQRAFLEKYMSVNAKMWEAYGQMAYITGYNHGRNSAERLKVAKNP